MSLSKCLRDRRGVSALEFALVAPVLLLLLLATTDIVLWMRTWLRMEHAASQVAQIIGQYRLLYEGDFAGTFHPIVQSALGSTSLTCNSGAMIVTGVDNSSGTPAISWQRSSGACKSSGFTLGSGYAPPAGLSAVVVELFTTEPAYALSGGIMATAGLSDIATYAVVVPRSGTLPLIKAGSRPP